MLKTSSLIYSLIILLCAFSIFLIIRVPQIYGWASLGSLLVSLLFVRLMRVGWVKWTSLGITFSVALFFIISGSLFHFDNSQNRIEFNKETAVNFEKGAFANHLAKAKKENKKVFLDIYTAWCGPCLQFNKTVLTNKEVAALMNEAFVNIKVDAEVGEGIEIGKKYVIGGYPTLLVLDSDGVVLEHLNPNWLPNSEQIKIATRKYMKGPQIKTGI